MHGHQFSVGVVDRDLIAALDMAVDQVSGYDSRAIWVNIHVQWLLGVDPQVAEVVVGVIILEVYSWALYVITTDGELGHSLVE